MALNFLRSEFVLVWPLLLSPLILFSDRLPDHWGPAAATAVLLPSLALSFLPRRRWPTKTLIGLFGVSALLGLLATAFPRITVHRLALLLLGIAIYAALSSIRRDLRRLLQWTTVLLLSVSVLAVAGPFITEFTAKNRYFSFRWVDSFPLKFPEILDPNILAALIALVLPVLTALCIAKGILDIRQRRALCVLLCILLAALVFTESRAGYLAAVAGNLLLLSICFPRLRLVVAVGLMVPAGFVFMSDSGTLLNYFPSGGALTTWAARKEFWERAIWMIQDFPITGIGAGTFPQIAPTFYPFYVQNAELEIFHAHNLLLQVAIDFGVPCLVAFVALMAATGVLGVKAYRAFAARQELLGTTLTAGYLSGLTGTVCHGFFDAPLWLNKPSAVLFFFMGMVVCLYRLSEVDPLQDSTGKSRSI